MKRLIAGTLLGLGLSTSASAMYLLPYKPEATQQMLASIAESTKGGVHFSGPDAKALWRSMYAACSDFGIDGRYVFYDTLFRMTLIQTRLVGEKSTYMTARMTRAGLVVDVISPPNRSNPNPLDVRAAVIDRSGKFLSTIFTERGVKGACEGAQGSVFVDDAGLDKGPPE